MARVLVVDDDPDLTKLMEAKLRLKGHEVFSCHQAKRAFDFAKTVSPDFVFLDAMLGDGTGYAVARQIRRDPELYKVGILFQSVADEPRDVEYALGQGGDEYIIKPYSLAKLLEKMEQLERLKFSVEQRCPITNLPSLAAMRREVEKALLREEQFALCYLFMKGLRAYRLEYGSRAEDKIAFYTSKIIHDVLKREGIDETYSCHLGGGYFMVKVNIEDYKGFRETVKARFHARLDELKASGVSPFAQKSSNGNGQSRTALTELLVAVTHTGRKAFQHAHEMFETLRQSEKVAGEIDQRVRSGIRKAKRKGGHEHWVD